MERLTKKRIDDGEAYLACVELRENECDGICTTCWRAGEAVDKLAAYEDTGLTPEEIKSAITKDALIKLTAQALETTPERLRELAAEDRQADSLDGKAPTRGRPVPGTDENSFRTGGRGNVMERLTKRTKTGGVLMASEHEGKYTTEEWICMLQDRLADYEDPGVTPEQVVWMKEVIEMAFDHDKSRVERAHDLHVADKEGRDRKSVV